MSEEVSSTATVGFSLGGSLSFLETFGIIPEGSISGADVSALVLISNDYNPSDPGWVQIIDQLIPDEIGGAIQVNVQDGAGLGGHLALEAALFPSQSPTEILTDEDVQISVMAGGGGGSLFVTDDGQITGAGVLLGAALGLEVSISAGVVGFTLNAEDLEINVVIGDEVHTVSGNSVQECFPANTRIRLCDGTEKLIQGIRAGETVLAYDAIGTPVPGRVTKLFRNTTSEFIRLSFDDREDLIATPILLRQFKLYSKDDQPVAFLTWASVSDAVRARVEAGEPLALEDWRSGASLVVVDVVSPFAEAEGVRERFLAGVSSWASR